MLRSGAATPSPSIPFSKSRICKKLVVKGHACSYGASYTLFLRVQLPSRDRQETHTLIADAQVELQDAVVHCLDSSGAAPALSTSAATAANALGIPLSIDHELNDSFIDFDSANETHSRGPLGSHDHTDVPAVVRQSDGSIILRSNARSSPRAKLAIAPTANGTSYMVTLRLFVQPESQPPMSPFSVCLPIPSCLNNFMRFTVDESIDDKLGSQGMTVEVDPPILSVSSPRRPSRRRSSASSSHLAPSIASYSDQEADVTLLGSASVDDSDIEQDDTAIMGPFQACDALVIRIAAQQAGDLVSSILASRVLPNALKARRARCSIAYERPSPTRSAAMAGAPVHASGYSATAIAFEATLQLEEPFFPGLDREVLLYIHFDPELSIAKWQPVAVDASRGILSWSFNPIMSSSSSPSQKPAAADEALLAKPPTFEIEDLVVLPEPSLQPPENEDLLSVAPPKGIDNVNFDFSLDNAAAPTAKRRRFSLQSTGSSKILPSQPPSEPTDTASAAPKILMVAFSLLPVLQGNEPLTVTVRGSLEMNFSSPVASGLQDLEKLPRGLIVPAALTHEYTQPTFVHNQSTTPQGQPSGEQPKSLEDSRETVQQTHDQALSMQISNPTGDAKTDEVLRQALAIIAAHNETLSKSYRQVTPSFGQTTSSQEKEQSRNDWMLRISHMLWTLFLTAMIFMLFNAGQNANRALSAKLDELSRIVEAYATANAQSYSPPQAEAELLGPGFAGATSIPKGQSGFVFPSGDSLDGPHVSHDASTAESVDLVEERPSWQDGPCEDDELHPSTSGGEVSHYRSSWLQELLRMPALFIQRFLRLFIGA
ncbi:uncharacterized protein MEPE_05992 [Melanopsichium pennsylvanicum]|uniref:Uncharacterized protein n=2 Tax=Melanopsichium pennsylvanicum TaxID=63383 RepID=A0AAJ4XSX1_9BASI|nr:putative protein [Melanopsichium pennsylvanicum 4]SNX87282.1 uncharacterized protein MEPE_05992 [Melanopsichium pennsylvanicum]